MFEYLMPSLLMRDYPGTLLSQSDEAAVDYQIALWGASARPLGHFRIRAITRFDANLNYQYRAFGAPRLGFKRGLAKTSLSRRTPR